MIDVPANHKKYMWIPLLGRQLILLSVIGIEEGIISVKRRPYTSTS